jgi:pyruvate/2-oxoglutarate/acetoin dehydrogenase E1 component
MPRAEGPTYSSTNFRLRTLEEPCSDSRPVRRVAAMDTFVAYQPLLEDAILPQPENLYKAMAEMAKY